MNEFRFGRAWTKGLGFFGGQAASHAIILIGVGVVAPIVLQVLLLGRPTTMMSSAGAFSAGTVAPAAILAATGAGYVLQTGSFFASWRLGLARGETLKGALGFGMLAGLIFSFGVGLALVVVGVAFGMITPPVAAAAVVIAFVGLVAIAWTVYAALVAAAVCLMFLLALGIGAAMGNMTYAATMVGGSGFVWTFLVAASLLLLWLAGRLSCTAVLMAERKSFNPLEAMRESWSLTWDDEWRVMRYLGLLGLAMAIVMFGAIALATAGLAATLDGTNQAALGTGVAVLLSALSIPIGYLSVLVPVGIYRELVPSDVAAVEVFV